MELLPIITHFLAVIGFLAMFSYVVLPIIKIIIFVFFYNLIMVLNFDMKKVILHPINAIDAIFKRSCGGIMDYLTSIGTITECKYGDYIYEPLFKIRKE